MRLKIEPTKEHKMPYVAQDDETTSFMEELELSANTQELLDQLGTPPEMDEETAKQAATTIDKAIKTQNKNALSTPGVAFAAREFIRVYSARLATDMSDVRSALTNKLLELANCGDARFELKAIELLGKHSDIALFTERSEVTINYKTSSDLETAIRERVKRLLNADIVDVTPITLDSLDDELGVATPKAKKDEEEAQEDAMVEDILSDAT
jgi:hypothetical protein